MQRSTFRSRFAGNHSEIETVVPPSAEGEGREEAMTTDQTTEAPPEATALPTDMNGAPLSSEETLHNAHAEDESGKAATPVWIGAILSVVWLAAVAAALYVFSQNQPQTQPSLIELAIFAAGATAPLSVIWLVAGLFALRARAPAARVHLQDALQAERRLRRASDRLAENFTAFDGALAIAEQRADTLSSGIQNQVNQLVSTIERLSHLAENTETRLSATAASLGTSSETLDTVTTRIAGSVERASEQVAGMPAILDPLAGRIDGLAEKLQNTGTTSHDLAESLSRAINQLVLRQRDLNASLGVTDKTAADILSRIETVTASLADQAATLDERSRTITDQLATSRDEIAASMNDLTSRMSSVYESTRTMAEQQADALEATLETLRARINSAANETMNELAHQTQHVSTSITTLLSQFATQRQAAAQEVAGLHETWQEIESLMSNGLSSQEQGVSELQQRLRALGDEARVLPQALNDGMAATDQMQNALVETQREAARLTQSLAATIEQALEARSTVAAAAEQSNSMAGGMQSVSDSAAQLSATLATASETLDRQREELDNLQQSMTQALAEITPALSAAREATQSSAIQSSSQLVDALGRIRAMTAQASEALKTAADDIVQTAQATLRRMSVDSIRDELVQPLRETMTEVQAVSQRGVEATRAAVGHLHGEVSRLNELATTIERRVAETDAYLGQVAEQDLSRAAAQLIESLNSAAIDIAKMLGTDVSDNDWQAYLKGDRSIFVRRAVKLADRGERSQILRLFDSDNEFRDQVRRYVRDFERLIGRTMAERDGQTLSVTLLSSDLGKLYVMLAQSINRLNG